MLDARDVPAALYWNPLGGSDLLASTANNWVDGVGVRATAAPGAVDDLYFNGIAITPEPTPTTSNAVVDANGNPVSPPPPPTSPPSPPVFAQADCYVTSSDPNQSVVRTYNGVHVLAGYTGTVDFKVSTFVGHLELRGGNIAQNDAFYATAGGGHLAVTVHLDWTGGTLNSGPTAGWVHLVGATGMIDPGVTGTLKLGSTTSLQTSDTDGAAALTIESGTINQGGGWGVIVGESCVVTQAPPSGGSRALPVLRIADLNTFDWTTGVWDDLPDDPPTTLDDDLDLSLARFSLQPAPQPPPATFRSVSRFAPSPYAKSATYWIQPRTGPKSRLSSSKRTRPASSSKTPPSTTILV